MTSEGNQFSFDDELLSSRRKGGWVERLARLWDGQIRSGEYTFMIDSIPGPVAHIARQYTTSVCREDFHTAPVKGYGVVSQHYYIG